MNAHTPGPWHVESRTTRGEFVTTTHIVNGDGDHVAIVQPCAIKPNARLIAAAPDLLAACELIESLAPSGEGLGGMAPAQAFNVAASKIRAAIAKARELS